KPCQRRSCSPRLSKTNWEPAMIRLIRDARPYLELPGPAALIMVVAAAVMVKADAFGWSIGIIASFYAFNFAKQYFGSRLQRADVNIRPADNERAREEAC